MTALDQAIRDQALDPQQSFIVEAPAGSGKTELLVRRFLKLLDVAKPESILAITFTRKAAHEMKERIHKALGQNQLELNIMTLDALCRQIVMQQPVTAAILGLEMLKDESALQKDLLASLLETIEAGAEGAADLIKVFQHFDNDLTTAVAQLLALLKNREQWLPIVLQAQNNPGTVISTEMGIQFLANTVLDSPLFETGKTAQANPEKAAEILRIKALIPELFTQKWALRQKVPVHLQALKQELQDSPDLCERYIHIAHLPDPYEPSKPILEVLLRVLPLIAAHLQVVLLKRQETDYHEIALSALNLLKDPSKGILANLDYTIKHILVDEFQDTSKLQFQLLQLLTEGWQPHDGRTLFLVGDPKQSIYRFRNADVGLFLDVKQNGLNHLKLTPIQLRQNFRTSTPLLTWINQSCAGFFPITEDERLGQVRYVASHSVKPGVAKPVVMEQFETESDEANWIAAQIQQLPNQSIAILVRARNHYSAIITALDAAGLKYAVKDDQRWQDSPFVDDLCALLYAIHHPADKLSWLSLLYSPLCNWSMQKIYAFIESGVPLSQALPELAKLDPDVPYIKFQRAFELLHYQLSPTEQRIFAYFKQVLLHLDFLPEQNTLKAKLARYDFGELPSDAAIQLLTIHQAKGLEFDAVFLPCLQKRVGRDETSLLYTETFYEHGQFHFLVAEPPAKGEEPSSLYRYVLWLDSQRAHHEMMRLLYVAMTRAKEYLFLSHFGDKRDKARKGSFLSLLAVDL